LRPSPTFLPLTLPILDPVAATASLPFTVTYIASGGIPVYHWDIVAGALPPGLRLDPFTGTVSGTPTMSGSFSFTVRVRDYREGSPGVSRATSIFVASAPRPRLELAVPAPGGGEAQLILYGTPGQQQVIQASSNLVTWPPVATNLLGTSLFQFFDPMPLQCPARFYRAQVLP
jgi:hypothetical protein